MISDAQRMPLAELLATVKVGSEDWGWDEEAVDLWTTDYSLMKDLTASIEANGQLDPVMIGSDGRLWDGHHRVVALMALGQSVVWYVRSNGAD